MNVGQWMDMVGIHKHAKAKSAAPKAPAQPPQAAQPAQANGAKQTDMAGAPAKRIRRAANPEKHLAELRALLESHGELVSTLGPVREGSVVAQQALPAKTCKCRQTCRRCKDMHG